MNRRKFISLLSVAAPALFIPKLITVDWGVKTVQNKYVPLYMNKIAPLIRMWWEEHLIYEEWKRDFNSSVSKLELVGCPIIPANFVPEGEVWVG